MNREGINQFINEIGMGMGMKDNIMRVGIKAHIDSLEDRIKSIIQEKEEYKKVLYMIEPNLEDALKDAVEVVIDKYEVKE